MLDDLSDKVVKAGGVRFKAHILPGDFDMTEALGFLSALMAQTTLFDRIAVGHMQDSGIDHNHRQADRCDGNDPFGKTDHIGSHAYTGAAMSGKRIDQVPGDGQVLRTCLNGRLGKEEGILDDGADHDVLLRRKMQNSARV